MILSLTWTAFTEEKCALKIYSKLRHKCLKQSDNRQILLSLSYCTEFCQYLASRNITKEAVLFSESKMGCKKTASMYTSASRTKK